MALIGKDPVELTTSLQTIYTVPAGFETKYIVFQFLNRHSSNVKVTVHLDQDGTADNLNLFIEHNTDSALVPGETREEGYARVMNPGDIVKAKANVTQKINLFFSAEEVAV